jgi:excisionase family DNA binding protein
MSEAEDSLIGVSAVAKMLGVSPRTVQRWVADGDILEPYRIVGVLRWNRKALAEWIESTKLSRQVPLGEQK